MRRAIVLVISLMSAGSLAGCGGGTSPGYPTPAALFTAIDAQALQDKTVTFTLTANGTGPTPADQAATTVDGAMRVEKPLASLRVRGSTQSGGEPPVDLEFVSLPQDSYVRLPVPARRSLPAGKSWVHVTDAAADATSRRFTSMVGGIRDIVTPAAQLSGYVGAMTIDDAATDVLDGVSCTRYQLRVDLAKTAAIATDPRIQATARQLLGSGMQSYGATLWADDQNRVLRVAVTLGKPTDRYGYATEVRYRDWGRPVQIDTPPADEVAVVS